MIDRHLLKAAHEPGHATLVVRNGLVVNVCSGEIYPGGVACCGDRIIAVGDVEYTIGPETKIIEAGGRPIVPGFVEAHIHPESSNLSVQRFAEIMTFRGTTSVFTDWHEVGIVRGLPGMQAVLEEGRKTAVRFFWCVPSHIPFNPAIETAGVELTSKELIPALDHPQAVALNEVIAAYVLQGHDDLEKTVAAALSKGKTYSSHAAVIRGLDWNAFASTGVANDHESITAEDLLLRVRSGVHAHLRINPNRPGKHFFETILNHRLDTRYISLATDDTNSVRLVKKGHLDELARSAMAHGIDFMSAIQMVTVNPATSYHLERKIGCLSPGNFADLLILSDSTEQFQVDWTISSGAVAMDERKILADRTPFAHDPVMSDTFHVASLTPRSFLRDAQPGALSARVHVMKTDPADPYTGGMEAVVPVVDGALGCAVVSDILHIAVVERHHATGRIGKGWIQGFGLKNGALAISMAHDSHNIIVIGADPRDMLAAVERLTALQGGLVFVEDGRVTQEIATPQFGLLTDLDAWSLCDELSRLMALLQARGCPLAEPHMRMMFFTIACGPYYRLTDRGYVKAMPDQFQLMENVLEWKS
jgi:adenine deaminase